MDKLPFRASAFPFAIIFTHPNACLGGSFKPVWNAKPESFFTSGEKVRQTPLNMMHRLPLHTRSILSVHLLCTYCALTVH